MIPLGLPMQSIIRMGNNPLCIVLVIREFLFPPHLGFGNTLILTNERTGYGAHGDYLFGWEDGALQRAMDGLGSTCFSETCPDLKLQSWDNTNTCNNPQQAKEDVGSTTCMFCLFALSSDVDDN